MINESGAKKISYITEDTVIKGDLNTSSSLIVKGKVLGNLISSDDVEIRGTVQGDVKANNVNIVGSNVTGGVSCIGNLYIDKDSQIDGNVIGNQAKFAGVVKGQVNIQNSVELLSNAIVEGDITASTIAIEHGATIKGFVNISKANAPKVEPLKEVKPAYFNKIGDTNDMKNLEDAQKEDEKVDDFVEEL